MKICAKCKIEKEENDFTASQLKLNWGKCKVCVAIKGKKWYQNNIEKTAERSKKWYQNNKEKHAANSKRWYQNNKEKHPANGKKWAQENREKNIVNHKKWRKENPGKVAVINKKWKMANPEKVAASNKKWARENPIKVKTSNKIWVKENSEKLNAKRRDRYQNDPVYRNRCIVSVAIYTMIKSQGASKKGESSHNYVPWTLKEYRTHIESLFEPWMNWNNQGIYNPKTHHLPNGRTWQLDHIIPQSDLPFNSLDHPNLTKAWNLSNLRPLDAEQNIIDGATKIRHRNKERK